MENSSIAVVGVSCRFAAAPDPGAFWRLIMHRESGITPLESDVALPPGGKNLFDRTYPTHGGQLGKLYACVPRDITFPRQINSGENQDLYFAVQLAFDALIDAGMRAHPNHPVRGSVRLGYAPPFSASTLNWLEHTFFIDQTMDIIRRFFRDAPQDALDVVRGALVDSLPVPDADSFLSGLGHRVAGWIARECSFSGGATTLDAGSLSGIAALRAAIDDLRSGRADVALAGALASPLNRALLQGLSGEVPFSRGAELVPFSRDSTGTIPGEGGAFFVLKREADALKARDRIYGLVRSVACGDAPIGTLLEDAARRADTPLTSIQLIEGDGCGIPEVDSAQILELQKLWGEHHAGGPLVGLGSVKGNIGHCFRASAAASILKTVLALRRKVLPPQLPAERPFVTLDLGSSVYLLNEPRPWITGDPSSPRRAAVLVNDFGGRRAAIVLEEEPTSEDRQ